MQIVMIILRLIHIFGAIAWVGGLLFVLGVIQPVVQEAGPDGGRFMQRLAASGRLVRYSTAAGVTTVLAGLILYYFVSGQLNGAWFRTGYGIGLTIGAIAGLLALGYGYFVTGRVATQLGALAKEMLARQGPPDPAQLKQAQALGARMGQNAMISAVIMAVAVFGMSAAQYL